MIVLLVSFLFGLSVWHACRAWGRDLPAVEPRPRGPVVLARFLSEAGLQDVTQGAFVAFSVASGLLVGGLTQLVAGMPAISAAASVMGSSFPYVYWSWERDRARSRLQEALAEALSQMRSSIGVGSTIYTAVLSLGSTGPDVLRPHFRALGQNIEHFGFEPAIQKLKGDLADPLFDTVATALVVSERIGGDNLPEVLDNLALTTRKELAIQKEIRSRQVASMLEARILTLLSAVLLLVLNTINPEYTAFFRTFWGQVVLAICALWLFGAYFLMRRLSRLPTEERVLG